MFKKQTGENWLIVGLGNPGREYERTRHNCGFRAVDVLAEQLGCKIDKLKFQGLYCQTNYAGSKLFLLKPQTYMNLSGEAVREAANFYKIAPEHVIVIADDVNFAAGKLRVRGKGSDGGHNGLKSIAAQLQSSEYPRIKVGVGVKPHPEYDLADWVLSNFSKEENEALAASFDRIYDGIALLLKGDLPAAMQACNGK